MLSQPPNPLIQGLSWFKGSIGSGLNRFKVLIGSRVQLVQGFNWFKASIGSGLNMFAIFNWFDGSIGSKIQLV